MKEYKSISIKIDVESRIEDKLNEFAKEGWSIVQVITKHINHDSDHAEFIYVLERKIKKWLVYFQKNNCEDWSVEYLAVNKLEMKRILEERLKKNPDEYVNYFKKIK